MSIQGTSNHTLPQFITFTGIDDRTDLNRADQLAKQYPIEWGILFSGNNRDARFPCNQAVSDILTINGRKSAHLCGSVAKRAVLGDPNRNIPLDSFDRVQVNGYHKDTSKLAHLQSLFGVNVILQHRTHMFPTVSPFQHLFDLSGGEGALPDSVPYHPDGSTLVGYAGGMGPDTVQTYLNLIPNEVEGPYWIDMEGRIRTDGWFDLDKVEHVCKTVFG